jgi:hypothetical protein
MSFTLVVFVETLPYVDTGNLANLVNVDAVAFQQVSDLAQHLFLRRWRGITKVVRQTHRNTLPGNDCSTF